MSFARVPPRGLLALALGGMALGFAAIFVRWADPAGPSVIGLYRMLFALPLLALLAMKHEADPGTPAKGRPWALLGGLFFTTDLTLWHTAVHHTSAGNATLIIGMAPLWVNLFMVLFAGTRLRAAAWAGLALALAGAAILGLVKGARLGTGLGEALSLIASFCYAGYTLCLGKARRHLSSHGALLWVVPTCLAGFAILSLVYGDPLRGFPARTWLALLSIALVVQVGGWWLISWSMSHIPTGLASIGLLLQPVATVFLGWLFLREALSPAQGFGTLLIVIGIGLNAFGPPVPVQTHAQV